MKWFIRQEVSELRKEIAELRATVKELTDMTYRQLTTLTKVVTDVTERYSAEARKNLGGTFKLEGLEPEFGEDWTNVELSKGKKL